MNLYDVDENGCLTDYHGNDTILHIPDGVKAISKNVFAMNQNIRKVFCPNTLLSIADGAFERCYSLEVVQLNPMLESIGEGSFFECCNLKKIYIPASVTFIDMWAFNSCTELERIDVSPNNLFYSSVDGILFNKTATKLLVFPNKNRKRYIIHEDVLEISPEAFFRCISLESITINQNIHTLYCEQFEGCKMLFEINVHPDNPHYKSIHGALFTKSMETLVYLPAMNATRISIPNCIHSISCEYSPVYKLSDRISFEMKSRFTLLNEEILIDLDQKSIVAIGRLPKNEFLLNHNDYSWSIGLFQYNSHIERVSFPDNMTVIPPWCFDSCIQLHSLNFSNSIIEIADNAFRDCYQISELCFPNNLCRIGDNAFIKCRKIQKVILPNSVKSIGEYSFFGCDELEEVIISSQMKTIPRLAFAFCPKLKSITIPDTVMYIDETAFYRSNCIKFKCTSNSYANNFAYEHNIEVIYSNFALE